MFSLENILWHVGCSIANRAQEILAENEAKSIKIQKGQIKIAQFSQKKVAGKRSLDTQEHFRHLWQRLPAGIQEIFNSKSRNVWTILILCRKEISFNRSSGYVECRIDKTDKKVFFECSKLHRSKSVNGKISYRSKREHYFFRMFLWTLGL